jgi:hypothetical protein
LLLLAVVTCDHHLVMLTLATTMSNSIRLWSVFVAFLVAVAGSVCDGKWRQQVPQW